MWTPVYLAPITKVEMWRAVTIAWDCFGDVYAVSVAEILLYLKPRRPPPPTTPGTKKMCKTQFMPFFIGQSHRIIFLKD